MMTPLILPHLLAQIFRPKMQTALIEQTDAQILKQAVLRAGQRALKAAPQDMINSDAVNSNDSTRGLTDEHTACRLAS